jgi:hypothetical protein
MMSQEHITSETPMGATSLPDGPRSEPGHRVRSKCMSTATARMW